MADKFLQHFLQIQRLRTLPDKRQHDDADRRLKRRKLKQLIQNDFFVSVLFQDNVQSDLPAWSLAVRQVDDSGNAFDSLVTDQQFKFFANAVARVEIRDLGHNDDVTVLFGFEMSLRAQCERRAAGLISLTNAVSSTNDAAGRKIWPRQNIDQLVDRRFRFVNQHDDGVSNLTQVMRRNARCHADGDTG